VVGLHYTVPDSSKEIVMANQENKKSEADVLYRIRHSTAHIMAAAVQQMFPDAKFAIGPPIKDGFYYDFDLPRPLSTDDLEEIEGRMEEIVGGNHKFLHETWDKNKAREFFSDQPYKLELIEGIEDDEVSIYTVDDFTDLCAGPHVRYSKKCKRFKLQKVAGAYWRGDENQPMLQRIYGTAWRTKDQLDTHLHRLEEAKRRDHRKLGKELDLFAFDRLAPGSVFWRPKGWHCYRELKNYFRELEEENDYVEIHNPMLYNKELFETSGHWEHYREHTFHFEQNEQTFCLKPMNCPDTMLYFGSKKRSYRELPLRVAEFGHLHRNELAGALSGATRVRQFMQDDAHIFCTHEQIYDEVVTLMGMIDQTYQMLGLTYELELSTRPDDFMGAVELWDEAEAMLKEALDNRGEPYRIHEGDGAFYGPKIDIQVRDSLGRSWQCGTIQLDFQLPRRFELTYTAPDNSEQTPVVIHRAISGSLERFFAILIEHYAGAFPTWLAPTQAVVIPITDEQNDYAWEIGKKLRSAGVRFEVDDSTEKMGKKIREHETQKVPYMLVVGGREEEAGTVALRTYSDGRRGTVPVDEVVDEIRQHIGDRELDVDVQPIELAGTAEDDEIGADMEDRGY
jgi:threonyl-tRNA synthetase